MALFLRQTDSTHTHAYIQTHTPLPLYTVSPILPLHCQFYVCIGGAVAVITQDKRRGEICNKQMSPAPLSPPYPQYPASQPIGENQLIQLWFLPTPTCACSCSLALYTGLWRQEKWGIRGGEDAKRQGERGREQKKQQKGMWKCCGEMDIMTLNNKITKTKCFE